eukprot:CAMPEP_0172935794 /NCGR_PEP_ID=MMETSP1075-20121228/221695_1 /TAXON_ID=2916 /ORGANISM="Ceratium fusus, Strain PA161109" /LENGTH=373 /DNA_ID=CAMNT_0013797155 /DNA_START=30 /DNA_END=1151 /DNA_ORIENTATION=-
MSGKHCGQDVVIWRDDKDSCPYQLEIPGSLKNQRISGYFAEKDIDVSVEALKRLKAQRQHEQNVNMLEFLEMMGFHSCKQVLAEFGILSLTDLKAFALSKDVSVQDNFDACMEAVGMGMDQVSQLEILLEQHDEIAEGWILIKKVLDELGFTNQQILITFLQQGVNSIAGLKRVGEDRVSLGKIALATRLSVKDVRRLQRGIHAWCNKNEQVLISAQLGIDALCEVFFSLRFSGDQDQRPNAKMLKEVLDGRSIGGFLCAAGLGESFGEQIRKALFFCNVLVAFVVDSYGEDSGTKFTTYYELDYAFQNGRRIVPLRLSQDWPPKCNNCTNGQALTAQVFSPSMVYLDCRTAFDVRKVADKIEAVVQKERCRA